MNVNGKKGDLIIQSVDAQGVVAGVLFGGVNAPGLWNETSRTLTFTVRRPGGAFENYEPFFFRGFLFSTPTEPAEGEDILWTLTGSASNPARPSDLALNSLVGVVGTARHNEFGWFAQLTQVV